MQLLAGQVWLLIGPWWKLLQVVQSPDCQQLAQAEEAHKAGLKAQLKELGELTSAGPAGQLVHG